jgi:hypothetical protein
LKSSGVVDSTTCLVVVAADDDLAKVANFFDDLVGIRAVTHEVAKTNRFIVFSGGEFETSVESFEIGMDVTEQ